jgi:hypothetical protein
VNTGVDVINIWEMVTEYQNFSQLESRLLWIEEA